jgi:hypothetical protein
LIRNFVLKTIGEDPAVIFYSKAKKSYRKGGWMYNGRSPAFTIFLNSYPTVLLHYVRKKEKFSFEREIPRV